MKLKKVRSGAWRGVAFELFLSLLDGPKVGNAYGFEVRIFLMSKSGEYFFLKQNLAERRSSLKVFSNPQHMNMSQRN